MQFTNFRQRGWYSTGLFGAALVASVALAGQTTPSSSTQNVTVYKSATCGCCSKWVEHLKANGFTVKTVEVEDVEVPMRTYGVPSSLGSCHTALVGGYVVEGHVPADAVQRMLRERPPIAGIAVAGMPVGAPGMEVPGYKDAYTIVAFDKQGKTSVFEKR